MRRAFVFTLEATVTLLFAAVVVSGIFYLRLPTYSDACLFELASDFQQIAAKRYYSEFAAFSKGDLIAKKRIESDFSKIMGSLGDYCLEIYARSNEIKINCADLGYRTKIPTDRLFYDGSGFFELKMVLLA